MSNIELLREQWKELYSNTLPSLALSKSPKQPHWPVHVDHCFGRIVLDAVIGEGGPWHAKLKGPAVRNMSEEQLQKCVLLGQAIADGKENLLELNEKSLRGRGKAPKKRKSGDDDAEAKDGDGGQAKKAKREGNKEQLDTGDHGDVHSSETVKDSPQDETTSNNIALFDEVAHLIRTSGLTPYRQRVLLALLQVPPGNHTTYAAISNFLDSSARAVGNAMRNNPFAPKVPCHRVVAADGSIGGFGGEWGAEGKFAAEKKRLLRAEGVKFDGKGKVVGATWKQFEAKV